MNVGTAFYGYEFDGVQSLWNYCNCGPNTTSVNYGTYIKQRINKMGWTARFDDEARAPYLLLEGTTGQPGFITYDDPESTRRKVEAVLGKYRLGGVFMWDLSADYDGHSQDLLEAMYQTFTRYQKASPPGSPQ